MRFTLVFLFVLFSFTSFCQNDSIKLEFYRYNRVEYIDSIESKVINLPCYIKTINQSYIILEFTNTDKVKEFFLFTEKSKNLLLIVQGVKHEINEKNKFTTTIVSTESEAGEIIEFRFISLKSGALQLNNRTRGKQIFMFQLNANIK